MTLEASKKRMIIARWYDRLLRWLGFRKNLFGDAGQLRPYNFSVTRILTDEQFNAKYRGTLHDLSGKVNIVRFLGLASGEVLFAGADISTHGVDDNEIVYKFSYKRNGPAKEGWEEMSYLAGSANVFQIYQKADFSGLGLLGIKKVWGVCSGGWSNPRRP